MSPLISSATALYLGTSAVSRVYAGTAKVWPPVQPPQLETDLTPYMNSSPDGTWSLSGQRFEMADGSQGPIIPPIWYLGVPTNVQLKPADSLDTLDARRTDVQMRINQEQEFGHDIVTATTSDPRVKIIEEGTDERGRDFLDFTGDTSVPVEWRYDMRPHIPVTTKAAGGSDAHVHVKQPIGADGRQWILEIIGFQWRYTATNTIVPAGTPIDPATMHVRSTRAHRIPMDGAGVGPASGVRNMGGAATAGLILPWEIDPSHPAHTGRIDHVVAVACSWWQLYSLWQQDPAVLDSIERWNYYASGATDQTMQPGWPTGMRRAGPTWQRNNEGFMKRVTPFPISEEDYSGPNDYKGNIWNGSHLVLPADATPASLGITESSIAARWNAVTTLTQAQKDERIFYGFFAMQQLVDVFRDYGGRVVDTTGSSKTMPVYVQASAPTIWRQSISGPDFSYPDMQKIKAALRIMTGDRDYKTPNGAPLTAPRRGLPVKGFTTAAPTTPTTPAGVDYSGVTTAATFAATTDVTKVSGTVTLSTDANAPEGQSSAVWLTHTGTTDSLVERSFTPIDLTTGYLRMPVRLPLTTATGALTSPKADLRYIEVRIAESKTAYTAGNYIRNRVGMATHTQLDSGWSYGYMDPAWSILAGTVNPASIGYVRILINLFRTSTDAMTGANRPLVVGIGRIERVPKVGGKARVVIGIDDGGAAAYTTFLPKMQPYGFPATLFAEPGDIGVSPTSLTVAQIKELVNTHGWQPASHSYLEHSSAQGGSVAADFAMTQAKYREWGFTTGWEDFAWPGPGGSGVGFPMTADNKATVAATFRDARYTENSPDRPEMLPLANRYVSRCWLVSGSDTLAEWQTFVNNAAKSGGLAEFCFHNDPTGSFDDFMAWLKVEEDAGRIEVVTKAQALGAA